MPTLDECHPQIVRALQKQGWRVDSKPLFLRSEGFTIFADIKAQKTGNGQSDQLIVIEVKCFSDKRSRQDELYRAIGQYLIYRNALRAEQINAPLYLAIPVSAYNDIFSKRAVFATIRETGIKLIVVDTVGEEVVQWLD